jgi:hypothetical protein
MLMAQYFILRFEVSTIISGTALNRSQFFRDLTVTFYGFNRKGAKDNAGFGHSFWLQGLSGNAKGQTECPFYLFALGSLAAPCNRICRETRQG